MSYFRKDLFQSETSREKLFIIFLIFKDAQNRNSKKHHIHKVFIKRSTQLTQKRTQMNETSQETITKPDFSEKKINPIKKSSISFFHLLNLFSFLIQFTASKPQEHYLRRPKGRVWKFNEYG